MGSLSLLPAFANEAIDSQIMFRHILTVMSEPGTIINIAKAVETIEGGHVKKINENKLSCLWSVAQTLLDSDCSVFIYPSINKDAFVQSLSFYTGVSFVNDVKDANFIFLSISELTDLNKFNLGVLEKPHLSSTALVYVEEISEGDEIILSGPGIKESKSLFVKGLDKEKISLLENNQALYPCGIDFIFCSESNMTAIPRSSKVKRFNVKKDETSKELAGVK